MAERFFPLDFLPDGVTPQETTQDGWQNLFGDALPSGVCDLGYYGTDHPAAPGRSGAVPPAMRVTRTGSGQLRRAPGACLIRGTYYADDTTVDVAGSANPSGSAGPRYDRVVARLDAGAHTAATVVKEGVPATSPVAPGLTWDTVSGVFEISLGVWRMKKGQSAYAADDEITDDRPYLSYAPAHVFYLGELTTNQRDFVQRPTQLTLRVYVPPSGRLRVAVSAELENTVGNGFADLSFNVYKGTDTTGTATAAAARDRCARKQGPNYAVSERTIALDGLTCGLHTVVGAIRAAQAGSASVFDPRVSAVPEP